MIAERVIELLEQTLEAEIGRSGCLGELNALRCLLDAVEARELAEIHRADKARCPSARPSDVADDLKFQTGIAGADAMRRAKRAELCGRWPRIAAALAEARINAGHADLLAKIPQRYHCQLERDLEGLLETASGQNVDDFKKTLILWRDQAARELGEDPQKERVEKRGISFDDEVDGMGRMVALYDPESYAIVRNTVADRAQQLLRRDQENGGAIRSYTQRLADALVEICQGDTNSAGCGGTRAKVIVTIGWDDLIAGRYGHIVGGGTISAGDIRRLACENGFFPAVMGTDSQLLDLGELSRLATPAQRLALAAQYDGKCAEPDCDRPMEMCHAHHIDPWETSFNTDLDNLIPVCTRHHSQIHQGQLEIRRENGKDVWTRPPPPERPTLRTILRL